MSKMSNYSVEWVCPATGIHISKYLVCCRDGVCVACGHMENGTISHARKEVGRWENPSLWERFIHGKKGTWIKKD